MTCGINGGHYIITVQGLLPSHKLGFCQCHEHLFIKEGQSAKINPALRIDDYALTKKELLLYKSKGGAGVVDAQPLGCGRNAIELARVSKETGLNIIASTGFHKLIFYPEDHWIFGIRSEDFAKILVEEITNGMYVNGEEALPRRQIEARAGIIKTAIDRPALSPRYEELFIAAGVAAKETGVSIMCHTEMGEGALPVIELLLEQGVKATSIIVSHLDRRVDNYHYHKEVAQTGVYLEYDTIGRFKYHSDEEEASLILKMVEDGFLKQILLGLDTTRSRLKSYGGTIGLDYLLTKFIPLLTGLGLEQDRIRQIMVDNPGRALSIQKEESLHD